MVLQVYLILLKHNPFHFQQIVPYENLYFHLRLQITRSGFNISISGIGTICEALISPGPLASKINFLFTSELLFKASDLIFRTISVTSSLTPLIELYSCCTPSICIAVTAAPLIDDNKILLR